MEQDHVFTGLDPHPAAVARGELAGGEVFSVGGEEVDHHCVGVGVGSGVPDEAYVNLDVVAVVIAQLLVLASGEKDQGERKVGQRGEAFQKRVHRTPPFLPGREPMSHTSATSAFVGPNQLRRWVESHT